MLIYIMSITMYQCSEAAAPATTARPARCSWLQRASHHAWPAGGLSLSSRRGHVNAI